MTNTLDDADEPDPQPAPLEQPRADHAVSSDLQLDDTPSGERQAPGTGDVMGLVLAMNDLHEMGVSGSAHVPRRTERRSASGP